MGWTYASFFEWFEGLKIREKCNERGEEVECKKGNINWLLRIKLKNNIIKYYINWLDELYNMEIEIKILWDP